VFAHISRNILCLSLLPLVYPVSVPHGPSFYFRFSFFLRLSCCASRLSPSSPLPPPPPPPSSSSSSSSSSSLSLSLLPVSFFGPRQGTRICSYAYVSVAPNIVSYVFQAMFTFEIKRGTNSGRRVLMVTVQSVIAALGCG